MFCSLSLCVCVCVCVCVCESRNVSFSFFGHKIHSISLLIIIIRKHGLILKPLECFCVHFISLRLMFFLPSVRGTNWWIWCDEHRAEGEAQPRKVEMKTLVSRLRVACHQRSGKYNTWSGTSGERIRQDVFMSSELLCRNEQLPLRVWWCTPAEPLARAGGGRCQSARTGWCGSDGNEAPDQAGRGTSAVWSQTHQVYLQVYLRSFVRFRKRHEGKKSHVFTFRP